jgi:hypothetical protein
MNGELAQTLAIATHATMWLADARTRGSGVSGSLSFPSFVDMIAFDSVVDVDGWAQRLAGDGVDRLWLAVPGLGLAQAPDGLEPHRSAAFMGGTPVALLSTGSAGNRLWQGHWQLGTRVTDGAQIVIANYESEPVSAGPVRLDVDVAADELDRMLGRAAEFAERQELPHWASNFTEARRRWEGDGSTRPASAPDLFPDAWPDADSRRLADMVRAAWVFGGMGSWNDLGFDDGATQEEYVRISRDLFGAVMRAYVASGNSDWSAQRVSESS